MHFTTIEAVNFEAAKNVCQNPTLLPPYPLPGALHMDAMSAAPIKHLNTK